MSSQTCRITLQKGLDHHPDRPGIDSPAIDESNPGAQVDAFCKLADQLIANDISLQFGSSQQNAFVLRRKELAAIQKQPSLFDHQLRKPYADHPAWGGINALLETIDDLICTENRGKTINIHGNTLVAQAHRLALESGYDPNITITLEELLNDPSFQRYDEPTKLAFLQTLDAALEDQQILLLLVDPHTTVEIRKHHFWGAVTEKWLVTTAQSNATLAESIRQDILAGKLPLLLAANPGFAGSISTPQFRLHPLRLFGIVETGEGDLELPFQENPEAYRWLLITLFGAASPDAKIKCHIAIKDGVPIPSETYLYCVDNLNGNDRRELVIAGSKTSRITLSETYQIEHHLSPTSPLGVATLFFDKLFGVMNLTKRFAGSNHLPRNNQAAMEALEKANPQMPVWTVGPITLGFSPLASGTNGKTEATSRDFDFSKMFNFTKLRIRLRATTIREGELLLGPGAAFQLTGGSGVLSVSNPTEPDGWATFDDYLIRIKTDINRATWNANGTTMTFGAQSIDQKLRIRPGYAANLEPDPAKEFQLDLYAGSVDDQRIFGTASAAPADHPAPIGSNTASLILRDVAIVANAGHGNSHSINLSSITLASAETPFFRYRAWGKRDASAQQTIYHIPAGSTLELAGPSTIWRRDDLGATFPLTIVPRENGAPATFTCSFSYDSTTQTLDFDGIAKNLELNQPQPMTLFSRAETKVATRSSRFAIPNAFLRLSSSPDTAPTMAISALSDPLGTESPQPLTASLNLADLKLTTQLPDGSSVEVDLSANNQAELVLLDWQLGHDQKQQTSASNNLREDQWRLSGEGTLTVSLDAFRLTRPDGTTFTLEAGSTGTVAFRTEPNPHLVLSLTLRGKWRFDTTGFSRLDSASVTNSGDGSESTELSLTIDLDRLDSNAAAGNLTGPQQIHTAAAFRINQMALTSEAANVTTEQGRIFTKSTADAPPPQAGPFPILNLPDIAPVASPKPPSARSSMSRQRLSPEGKIPTISKEELARTIPATIPFDYQFLADYQQTFDLTFPDLLLGLNLHLFRRNVAPNDSGKAELDFRTQHGAIDPGRSQFRSTEPIEFEFGPGLIKGRIRGLQIRQRHDQGQPMLEFWPDVEFTGGSMKTIPDTFIQALDAVARANLIQAQLELGLPADLTQKPIDPTTVYRPLIEKARTLIGERLSKMLFGMPTFSPHTGEAAISLLKNLGVNLDWSMPDDALTTADDRSGPSWSSVAKGFQEFRSAWHSVTCGLTHALTVCGARACTHDLSSPETAPPKPPEKKSSSRELLAKVFKLDTLHYDFTVAELPDDLRLSFADGQYLQLGKHSKLTVSGNADKLTLSGTAQNLAMQLGVTGHRLKTVGATAELQITIIIDPDGELHYDIDRCVVNSGNIDIWEVPAEDRKPKSPNTANWSPPLRQTRTTQSDRTPFAISISDPKGAKIVYKTSGEKPLLTFDVDQLSAKLSLTEKSIDITDPEVKAKKADALSLLSAKQLDASVQGSFHLHENGTFDLALTSIDLAVRDLEVDVDLADDPAAQVGQGELRVHGTTGAIHGTLKGLAKVELWEPGYDRLTNTSRPTGPQPRLSGNIIIPNGFTFGATDGRARYVAFEIHRQGVSFETRHIAATGIEAKVTLPERLTGRPGSTLHVKNAVTSNADLMFAMGEDPPFRLRSDEITGDFNVSNIAIEQPGKRLFVNRAEMRGTLAGLIDSGIAKFEKTGAPLDVLFVDDGELSEGDVFFAKVKNVKGTCKLNRLIIEAQKKADFDANDLTVEGQLDDTTPSYLILTPNNQVLDGLRLRGGKLVLKFDTFQLASGKTAFRGKLYITGTYKDRHQSPDRKMTSSFSAAAVTVIANVAYIHGEYQVKAHVDVSDATVTIDIPQLEKNLLTIVRQMMKKEPSRKGTN